MRKDYLTGGFIILIVWIAASLIVHNDILIPYPLATFERVFTIIKESDFFSILFLTFLRVLKGFSLSLVLGMVLSVISFDNEKLIRILDPLNKTLKTIPNISFILFALLVFGSEGAVTSVTFMILFPILFTDLNMLLKSGSKDEIDAYTLFKGTFKERLMCYIIPKLFPASLLSMKTTISMGFKVGVMAEILGQVRKGIGRELYFSKLNLDTTSIFAWTLIIIFFTSAIDLIIDYLYGILRKKEA